MAELMNELSVFFPAYNEEGEIEDTVKKAVKVLQKYVVKWEIIIVDDGSSDRTPEISDKLANTEKYVRVVHHKPNRGYGAAFRSGFYSAKYDWIAFTDADGQFDLSEIDTFIEKQKKTDADVVIGYYKKRQVSTGKILTSRVWEIFVFLLFGLHVKDIDCGFKLVRKKVVDTIPKLESERGAFISSEFLIKAKKSGFKIVEVPVTHYPRKKGSGTGRNFGVIVNSFKDLFKLWKKLR
jgi:glycosyltransferase involved in cell wall biosynthesis